MGDIKEFKGLIDVKYIEEIINNLSEEEIGELLGINDDREGNNK